MSPSPVWWGDKVEGTPQAGPRPQHGRGGSWPGRSRRTSPLAAGSGRLCRCAGSVPRFQLEAFSQKPRDSVGGAWGGRGGGDGDTQIRPWGTVTAVPSRWPVHSHSPVPHAGVFPAKHLPPSPPLGWGGSPPRGESAPAPLGGGFPGSGCEVSLPPAGRRKDLPFPGIIPGTKRTNKSSCRDPGISQG